MKLKNALLLGVLILSLLVSTVSGTTYALQATDDTSNAGTIRTGNFDAKVYWSKDLENWQEADETTAIFSNNLWEPSHTQVRYIKIVNNGDFEFNYSLSFGSLNGDLSEVIDVYCGKAPASPFTSFSQLISGTNYVGTMASLQNGVVLEGALLSSNQSSADYVSGEDIFTVALHMQESAGNEYQDKGLENFSITLNATQFALHDQISLD